MLYDAQYITSAVSHTIHRRSPGPLTPKHLTCNRNRKTNLH